MKKLLCFTFILFSAYAFAQGEARNWYFGRNAGIQFLPDGTVVPLAGGQVFTTEGCSSMSDSDGNLLFYTDGRNVWDRRHRLMPNGNYGAGTGLMGDPSSTQSGIIVPKKGDPNIYYIFTVDEPHHDNASVYPNRFTGFYDNGTGGTIPDADDGFNNGFNYSVVDLSVTGTNGSIGDVVTRNQHLVTYDPTHPQEIKYKCSEKITAVKTADGTGFWVLTQFVDKFYAFKVDGSGVNATPVISTVLPNIPVSGYRRNSIGYLKASPDGTKLAIAHQQRGTVTGGAIVNGSIFIYDFNASTGEVSNGLQIKNNINPYGVEFSPEAKKLYITYQNGGVNGIFQYNLQAANIGGSEVSIAAFAGTGALQLGPNQKIYYTNANSQFLSVINLPEEDGALCDFQAFAVEVGGPAGKECTLGLPPFITSLFSASVEAKNLCLGNTTEFSLTSNSTFDSVTWNFGDGTPVTAPSTLRTATHTYSTIGNYTVTATVVKGGDSTVTPYDITISPVPVIATLPQNITECDINNDGIATFDLTKANAAILGSQSTATYDVKYYTSQANADNDTNAVNAAAFTNTANPQTIYARIFNKTNTLCHSTTSFRIDAAAVPSLQNNSYSTCDDLSDGNDTNGQTTFNLATVTLAILNNPAPFTVRYYETLPDAQGETGAIGATFYNTIPGQQIVFARITNTAFPSCFSIEPITLTVKSVPAPAITTGITLVQCDLGLVQDGLTQFTLSDADSQFTGGDANLTVKYYATSADAQGTGTALSNIYTNTANPQQVFARVENIQSGCFRVMPLTLNVNVNPTAPIQLEACDDGAEDGFAQFNLADAGLETGTNTVTYYTSANDALFKQNAVTAAFTNTTANQQSVYARVENNNDCSAIQEIRLVVRKLPNIDTTGKGVVCLNTREFITLGPGLADSSNFYAFEWSTGARSRTISVNQPGIYTVKVIDTRYASRCEKTRTITVTASDVAIITGIDIVDLTDNNTVTVHVRPSNNVSTNYLYSIDLPNGPFQASNHFEGVEAGIHTVYVYDDNGCGVVSKDIAVLSIPKFFTPNNDGVNETWNIIGVNSLFYGNSKIYIFDRFGKLLANVDPRGPGWNGIYSGTPLPATDYWFVLELDNGRTVKGHFSLIR